MTANKTSVQSGHNSEELAITLWRPEDAASAECETLDASSDSTKDNFSFGSRLTLGQRSVLSAYGVLVCGIGMFASFTAGMLRMGIAIAIVFAGYLGLAFITWREYRNQKN